jgi:hypothetical protein
MSHSSVTLTLDTTFNFFSDVKAHQDPDRYSRTLRRYHQILWSKALPDGALLTLDARTPGSYLHHKSALGEFFLASDSILHTYRKWKRLEHIIAQLPPDEVEAFLALASTIGGYMLFPVRTGGQTVNQVRGRHPLILDRFDLTLECIRLYYLGMDSPLKAVLDANQRFFALFGSFAGYVRFWFLQDLADDADQTVRFWLPFSGFGVEPALPASVSAYWRYRDAVSDFARARNNRISEWAEQDGL